MSRRSPEKIVENESERKASRRGLQTSYGYRGYGSGSRRGTDSSGGMVHWGSGFGGVGVAGGYAGNTLPQAGLFEGEAWDRAPTSASRRLVAITDDTREFRGEMRLVKMDQMSEPQRK